MTLSISNQNRIPEFRDIVLGIKNVVTSELRLKVVPYLHLDDMEDSYADILRSFVTENVKSWKELVPLMAHFTSDEVEGLVTKGILLAVADIYSTYEGKVDTSIIADVISLYIDEFDIQRFLPCQ